MSVVAKGGKGDDDRDDKGKRDGTLIGFRLYAAGSNACGQLGVGHEEDTNVWQPCVASFQGVGGDDDDDDDATTMNQPFPPPGWYIEHLSSGAAHTVVVLRGVRNKEEKELKEPQREIWMCGSDEQGQLFATASTYARDKHQGFMTVFHKLDHDRHLPLRAQGWRVRLVCCGWDWTFVALYNVATAASSLDSRHSDKLFVSGHSNDFGQLGLGQDHVNDEKDPVRSSVRQVDLASALQTLDDAAATSGGWTIERMACGLRHVLVLCSAIRHTATAKDDERIYALVGWGASRHGQVVPPRPTDSSQGRARPTSSATAKSIVWKPLLLQAWTCASSAVETNREDFYITAGKEHSVVCVPAYWTAFPNINNQEASNLQSGVDVNSNVPFRLHVFGSNRQSQLDVAKFIEQHCSAKNSANVVAVDCTWNATFVAIRTLPQNNVVIYASGSDAKGQVSGTLGSSFKAPIQLACGSEHVTLLSSTSDFDVNGRHRNAFAQGWGWNEHGNLAQGDEQDRHSPVQLWPSAPAVTDAVTGDQNKTEVEQAVHIFAANGTTYVQVSLDSS